MNWLELRNDIRIGLESAPTRTIDMIVEILEEEGINCILVATGDKLGPYPMAKSTIVQGDVSSVAMGQVLTPLLQKLGVPEPLVMMLAGAAGSAAARAVKSRMSRERKNDKNTRQGSGNSTGEKGPKAT